MALEETVLGPDHRLTLNTRANLALALLGQGKVEVAQTQFTDVVKHLEEKFGLGYPDPVNFTIKFATTLAGQGKVQEAIAMVEQAEKNARASLGPDDPVTRKYDTVLQSLKQEQ